MMTSSTPGVMFARYAKSIANGRGNSYAALAFAEGQDWRDTPQVVHAIKGATNPMSTSNSAALTPPVAFDLAEYLRPQTIVGKIQGFRRAPFNIRLVAATAGATGGFVGESAPIPVTAGAYNSTTVLPLTGVGAISVMTAELVRLSTPSAEMTIATDITAGLAAAMDLAFIDPGNAGAAGVSPASVTYGAPTVASTGSTIDKVDADLKALLQKMFDANINMTAPAWIMSPKTATSLSLLRGSGGALAYPGIGPKGGTLLNIPVVTSTAVKASGSPAVSYIALMDANEILLADDDAADMDYTDQASLQMDSAPTNPPVAATVMVSLWQMDLVGIRGLRYVNWQPRHSAAVVLLSGVTY